MKFFTACLVLYSMAYASVVFADVKTVALNVENMSCESCPYIVEKSLKKLNGIVSVNVSFEKKTAKVRYDDQKVEIAAMEKATRDAGFPASLSK